jgi:hypothetical protein
MESREKFFGKIKEKNKRKNNARLCAFVARCPIVKSSR